MVSNLLTDRACRNAQPKERPYKKADGDGMYLEVMPNGSKYWRMKYRHHGKEKRLAIGVFPEVGVNEARDKRLAARKMLASGTDPSFVKQEKRRMAALNAGNTFEVVAREWLEGYKEKLTEKTATSLLRRLSADIFPKLGHRPILEISAQELFQVVKQIEKRGAIEIANRTMQTCGQIFRYAIATGRAERNPVPDLRGALKTRNRKHYTALALKDLPEFLQKMEANDARLYALTRLALRLIVLTFVRTSELIGARWEEIHFADKQWIIPAERMKMRQPHIVPLARQTLAIFEEIRRHSGNREHVFPNQADPRKHMSNNTILKALERLGYKHKATGHGFRALAMSTIKEKLKYRHEVIDRQLAHGKKSRTDAAYDRAQFLDDRTEMMQRWADFLDEQTKK